MRLRAGPRIDNPAQPRHPSRCPSPFSAAPGPRQPQYAAYHDHEWGVPVHDDRVLFEFLILEGAQAGLSWSTILNKREGYREAFAGFDPAQVAALRRAEASRSSSRSRHRPQPAQDRERRGQCQGVSRGAERVRQLRPLRLGVRGRQAACSQPPPPLATVPARTRESDALSKDLRKRGFRFVGTTIFYAFMQATGLVNDHLVACPRWAAVQARPNSLMERARPESASAFR